MLKTSDINLDFKTTNLDDITNVVGNCTAPAESKNHTVKVNNVTKNQTEANKTL